MAIGGSKKPNAPISDINVTPLVDVMLVLLVIFMVTAPLMLNGIQLNLPKTKESSKINLNTKQIVLSFTTAGEYYLGKEKVLLSELVPLVKKQISDGASETLYLRADYKIYYGKVAELMTHLKRAGLQNIALVTELESVK